MPTILDLMHFPESFHFFGKSLLDKEKVHYSYQYNNGIFQIMDGRYALLFDGRAWSGMYDYLKDPSMKINIADNLPKKRNEMLDRLKAVIQRYQKAMINNELTR